MNLIALIPLLPLASAAILMASTGRMPRHWAAIFGAGSVGFSALCVAIVGMNFLADGEVQQLSLWTWMSLGDFTPGIAFYIDGLTLSLIHI